MHAQIYMHGQEVIVDSGTRKHRLPFIAAHPSDAWDIEAAVTDLECRARTWDDLNAVEEQSWQEGRVEALEMADALLAELLDEARREVDQSDDLDSDFGSILETIASKFADLVAEIRGEKNP